MQSGERDRRFLVFVSFTFPRRRTGLPAFHQILGMLAIEVLRVVIVPTTVGVPLNLRLFCAFSIQIRIDGRSQKVQLRCANLHACDNAQVADYINADKIVETPFPRS